LGDRRRGGSRARVRAATPVRRRHRVRPSRLRLPSARRTVAPRRLVAAAAGGRSAQKGVSLMATLLSLAAFAAVTVVAAAFTAPPRPAEMPTVDTVRRGAPDEEWARETTAEFRAIRADLEETGAFEWLRLTGASLDPHSRLKAELTWRRRRRLAGW